MYWAIEKSKQTSTQMSTVNGENMLITFIICFQSEHKFFFSLHVEFTHAFTYGSSFISCFIYQTSASQGINVKIKPKHMYGKSFYCFTTLLCDWLQTIKLSFSFTSTIGSNVPFSGARSSRFSASHQALPTTLLSYDVNRICSLTFQLFLVFTCFTNPSWFY